MVLFMRQNCCLSQDDRNVFYAMSFKRSAFGIHCIMHEEVTKLQQKPTSRFRFEELRRLKAFGSSVAQKK